MAAARRKSLTSAANAGDRRAVLEAQRSRLAAELESARGEKGSDVAALSRELRMVMGELDGLPVAGKVAKVDEFTARREARRRANAEGSSGT